jgi:glycosyltransferase involved in cell wall biosynthesis
MKELTVIMPVYNEDEIVSQVLTEWLKELRRLDIDFELCIYNDGSTDDTLKKIRKLEKTNKEIELIDKPNSGHGPTILQGYRQSKGDWIFQTDTDNEIRPDQFIKVWMQRNNGDFIIGIRNNRESSTSRKIVSFISKWSVWLLYGKGIRDVNCPYRLFKKEKFEKSFNRIPPDTFAPNIILSGITCHEKMNIVEVPVMFFARSSGEVSVDLQNWRLLKVAIKCWLQTLSFRMKIIIE